MKINLNSDYEEFTEEESLKKPKIRKMKNY